MQKKKKNQNLNHTQIFFNEMTKNKQNLNMYLF